MNRRTKNVLVFVAKLGVASGLIVWLVRGGALDLRTLGIYFQRPFLIAFAIGLFFLGVAIATTRWRLLLSLAGVSARWTRLLPLQLTALFFNVVIPGNVGGDVVKALYVARDAAPEKRTPILLIAFVERLLGLVGLVALGTLVTLVRADLLFGEPRFRTLATVVVTLGASMTIGIAAFVVVVRRAGDRLEAWTSGPSRIAKLLNQLVLAVRLLSASAPKLLLTVGLSMVGHACGMALFTVVARAVTSQDVSYAAVATVFPIGLLTLVLPISVAGVGVGHVAFDALFETIGLPGGANVFNVYLFGALGPCLFGVIPYLALRRSESPVPKE